MLLAYIPRQSDLKNACLVSQAMRTLAIEILYKRFVFNTDTRDAIAACQYLHPQNPGVKHIQCLDLKPRYPGEYFSDEDLHENTNSTLQTVRTIFLLFAMHRVRLRGLHLPGTASLDMETITAACTLQPCLEYLGFGGGGAAALLEYVDATQAIPWVDTLKELDMPVFIQSKNDIFACQRLLQHCKQLEKISIQKNWSKQLPVDDSEAWDGIFVRTLFQHVSPLGTNPPVALESLSLQAQQVAYAERTFMRVMDFTMPWQLHLWACPGTPRLLICLAALFRIGKPSLEDITIFSHGAQQHRPEEGLKESIELFLKSFTGLCYVRLVLCTYTTNHKGLVGGLTHHADSLLELSLGLEYHKCYRFTDSSLTFLLRHGIVRV